MVALIVYCVVFPAILSFMLRNSSRTRVIRAGLLVPVLIITITILLTDGKFLYLVELVYIIWVPVFLVSTYIFWIAFRKINIVRNR